MWLESLQRYHFQQIDISPQMWGCPWVRKREHLLLQSLLGTSSVLVSWDVSYSSCLMKLRLNILLIEHSSHAVNSLLRQKVTILKNTKMSFVLMSIGMECF